MILAILIVSSILSLIGAGFYKIFGHGHLKVRQEKLLIYSIVIISLIAPFAGLYIVEASNLSHSSYLVSSVVNNQDCDKEEIFAECQRIEADGGFCDCEEIMAQNIVAYKANQFYEFADNTKATLIKAFLAFGLLMILLLILRIGYLMFLILNSSKEVLNLEGIRATLLTADHNLSVGSFKIVNNYIIWDNRLDCLSENEKQAIILHEVSHLKQKNTWELLVLSLIQVFWFMNPAFYYLKNELIRISELIADEFAVDRTIGKKGYANLLLRLHEPGNLALVPGFSKSHTKERIYHLLKRTDKKQRSFIAVFTGMLLVMTLSTAISISYISSEQHLMEAYHTLKQQNEETGRTLFL